MDSPKDNFLLRMARAASEEDWKKVREIVDEEKHLQCLLAWDLARHLGVKFNCARAAKVIGINERTVRRWIKDIKA